MPGLLSFGHTMPSKRATHAKTPLTVTPKQLMLPLSTAAIWKHTSRPTMSPWLTLPPSRMRHMVELLRKMLAQMWLARRSEGRR